MAVSEHHRELFKRARDAWDQENWVLAAESYEALLADHPDEDDSPGWWFDAALAHKFLRNWPKALELGKQAAARSPRGEQDPAFWNLGIAATALHDWETARDAWAGFGIELPPGDGEVVGEFGMACVRIDTPQGQEVVWVHRICPARGVVLSVPFAPERRLGEVVLHDGAPNGERMIGDDRYPVFDELMLWRPSGVPTLTATIGTASAADFAALADLLGQQGYGAEPVDSAVPLCKCCSEGSMPATEHEFAPGRQQVLLGVPEEEVRVLLELWVSGDPVNRGWSDLHRVN